MMIKKNNNNSNHEFELDVWPAGHLYMTKNPWYADSSKSNQDKSMRGSSAIRSSSSLDHGSFHCEIRWKFLTMTCRQKYLLRPRQSAVPLSQRRRTQQPLPFVREWYHFHLRRILRTTSPRYQMGSASLNDSVVWHCLALHPLRHYWVLHTGLHVANMPLISRSLVNYYDAGWILRPFCSLKGRRIGDRRGLRR